jgi:hypothetical protein
MGRRRGGGRAPRWVGGRRDGKAAVCRGGGGGRRQEACWVLKMITRKIDRNPLRLRHLLQARSRMICSLANWFSSSLVFIFCSYTGLTRSWFSEERWMVVECIPFCHLNPLISFREGHSSIHPSRLDNISCRELLADFDRSSIYQNSNANQLECTRRG